MQFLTSASLHYCLAKGSAGYPYTGRPSPFCAKRGGVRFVAVKGMPRLDPQDGLPFEHPLINYHNMNNPHFQRYLNLITPSEAPCDTSINCICIHMSSGSPHEETADDRAKKRPRQDDEQTSAGEDNDDKMQVAPDPKEVALAAPLQSETRQP